MVVVSALASQQDPGPNPGWVLPVWRFYVLFVFKNMPHR